MNRSLKSRQRRHTHGEAKSKCGCEARLKPKSVTGGTSGRGAGEETGPLGKNRWGRDSEKGYEGLRRGPRAWLEFRHPGIWPETKATCHSSLGFPEMGEVKAVEDAIMVYCLGY